MCSPQAKQVIVTSSFLVKKPVNHRNDRILQTIICQLNRMMSRVLTWDLRRPYHFAIHLPDTLLGGSSFQKDSCTNKINRSTSSQERQSIFLTSNLMGPLLLCWPNFYIPGYNFLPAMIKHSSTCLTQMD